MKFVKIIKVVTMLWTAFTVIATAISMIPKYEKLKVDPDELIKQCETPDEPIEVQATVVE